MENATILAEEVFAHGLANAAQMLPIIDRLCRAHQWKAGDIEEVYVSVGPGSFTGLRIGITLAKTLSLATGAKIVAVPSVRVLAENAPPDARHVILVLDAKRGQIFTARFERVDGEWTERIAARLDTLSGMLTGAPRPVHLVGEGIPYHQGAIPSAATDVIVTPEASWRPRASVVARLGSDLAREGRYVDAMTLTPIYIRRPEAEEKFEDRAKQTNERGPD